MNTKRMLFLTPTLAYESVLILVSFLLLASSPASAGVTVVSTRTETSKAHNATFIEMKKEVVLPGAPKTEISYLTDTRFGYRVPTPQKIESLAIVQWIRGCIFDSEFSGGQVTKTLNHVRKHFGKIVPFQHQTWQIDSDITDPLYSADETYGRFALLRWNKDGSILDAEKATYYLKAKPPHGSVFVTDLPSSGFLASGSGLKDGTAQNTSLQFITCLFNVGDLPRTTTPEGAGIERAKALWCVNWDHQFIWNFNYGRMTSPNVIDEVCEVK